MFFTLGFKFIVEIFIKFLLIFNSQSIWKGISNFKFYYLAVSGYLVVSGYLAIDACYAPMPRIHYTILLKKFIKYKMLRNKFQFEY